MWVEVGGARPRILCSHNEHIFAHSVNTTSYHTFSEFTRAFRDQPVCSAAEIGLRFPKLNRRTVSSWVHKGLLHRVRNGFYRLAERPITELDRWVIANTIYAPSYISVRSALGYYGFIPEGVFHVESVTTASTKRFHYANTWYSYRSVRPSFFFGYTFIGMEGRRVMMATPEKTILDVLYLHPEIATAVDFEAWRFDETGILDAIDQDRIQEYLTVIASNSLRHRYERFNQWLHDRD
jgi:predicted transcriptional regulator of viral defense system